MRQASVVGWLGRGLALFIIVAVLWRGGKSLDMTWLLAGIASVTWIMTGIRSLVTGYWLPNRQGTKRPVTSDKVFDIPYSIFFLVFGFIGLTLLSFIVSSTRNYGFDELLQTTSAGLLLLWIVGIRNHPDFPSTRRWILKSIAIALLLACGIGAAVYVLQPVTRFVGAFFDYRFQTDYWPNAWAEYVLLAWPVLAYTLFGSQKGQERKGRQESKSPNVPVLSFLSAFRQCLPTLILGFVLGCLFLSYSRGAFIAFMGQVIVGAALLIIAQRKHLEWERWLSAAVLTGLVAMCTFALSNHVRGRFHRVESVVAKATFSSDEGASSASERKQFWNHAALLAAERPFLGWGPYSFRFVHTRLQTNVLATSDHPHNVLLKFATERGIPAAILFSVIVMLALLKALHHLLAGAWVSHAVVDHQLEPSAQFSAFNLRLTVFLSVVGVLAHNLIDYNLQFVGIVLPLWLLLGLLIADDARAKGDKTFPPFLSFLVFLPFLLALILLFAAASEARYLYLTSLARRAEKHGDAMQALQRYRQAGEGFFPRDQKLSEALLLLHQGSVAEARQAMQRYRELNPNDARAHRLLGDIEQATGSHQAALEEYMLAYAQGAYNDPAILRGLVSSALATPEKRRLLETMKPRIDALLTVYAKAVARNMHFIALSPSVEALAETCDLLGRQFPKEARQYGELKNTILSAAQRERGKITARSPGVLWQGKKGRNPEQPSR